MNNIFLFPTHEDYCKKCIYNTEMGGCRNKEYLKNIYYVNCVWKRCPYRKASEQE